MMRDGLRAVLERDHVEVVGEAATGHEALVLAHRLEPDIVIMDVTMPELNGIDATRRLVKELPRIKVLALSSNAHHRHVHAMLEAGATGYVLKTEASTELLRALSALMEGKTYVSSALVVAVLTTTAAGRIDGIAGPLSPREREVLQLLAEGKSSKEIAAALEVALCTVETHRRQVMTKLNLRTIAELTKYAIREGLTTLES